MSVQAAIPATGESIQSFSAHRADSAEQKRLIAQRVSFTLSDGVSSSA